MLNKIVQRGPKFTITLGKYSSVLSIYEDLNNHGHIHSLDFISVIDSPDFTLLAEPEEYDFFEATNAEVTGEEEYTVSTVALYEAQYRLGFIDAPDESACAICEVYDEPVGTWHRVLSKPVRTGRPSFSILCVEQKPNGSGLGTAPAHADMFCMPDDFVLLCRRRRDRPTADEEVPPFLEWDPDNYTWTVNSAL